MLRLKVNDMHLPCWHSRIFSPRNPRVQEDSFLSEHCANAGGSFGVSLRKPKTGNVEAWRDHVWRFIHPVIAGGVITHEICTILTRRIPVSPVIVKHDSAASLWAADCDGLCNCRGFWHDG